MKRATKRQTDAINALMQCETVSAAAKEAGVSRGTLCRWLNDSGFLAELRESRGRVYALSMSRLVNLTSRAVTVLAEAVDGKNVPKPQFVAACKVLEYAGTTRNEDLQTLADEIRELLKDIQRDDQ